MVAGELGGAAVCKWWWLGAGSFVQGKGKSRFIEMLRISCRCSPAS
jgi:hypothetical protein